MIELAPNHKTGLMLTNPVMTAAGCFGLGSEYARLLDTDPVGAVVVGPITAERRRGAEPPRLLPIAGGALLHTGLANPGLRRVVQQGGGSWSRMPTPVIVHVAGTSADSVARCCSRLATVDAVAGVELGVLDGAAPDHVEDVVRAAQSSLIQPLIVRMPLASAAGLCELAVEGGADALTVASPPRGTVWHPPECRFITGRLYGPFVLPLVLRAVQAVRKRVSVPLIGCGGVFDVDGARALLHAGCCAVQIGGAVWHDPSSLPRIARALAE